MCLYIYIYIHKEVNNKKEAIKARNTQHPHGVQTAVATLVTVFHYVTEQIWIQGNPRLPSCKPISNGFSMHGFYTEKALDLNSH